MSAPLFQPPRKKLSLFSPSQFLGNRVRCYKQQMSLSLGSSFVRLPICLSTCFIHSVIGCIHCQWKLETIKTEASSFQALSCLRCHCSAADPGLQCGWIRSWVTDSKGLWLDLPTSNQVSLLERNLMESLDGK